MLLFLPTSYLAISRHITGRPQLLEKWIAEDKLEMSEELGDLLMPADVNMALTVYQRANCPEKVINCLMQKGESDKIVAYSTSVGYRVDYTFMLQQLVRTNPQVYRTPYTVYRAPYTVYCVLLNGDTTCAAPTIFNSYPTLPYFCSFINSSVSCLVYINTSPSTTLFFIDKMYQIKDPHTCTLRPLPLLHLYLELISPHHLPPSFVLTDHREPLSSQRSLSVTSLDRN